MIYMTNKKYWVIEVNDTIPNEEVYQHYRIHSVYETREDALPVFEALTRRAQLDNDPLPSLMEYGGAEENNPEYFRVRFRCNDEKKIAACRSGYVDDSQERKEEYVEEVLAAYNCEYVGDSFCFREGEGPNAVRVAKIDRFYLVHLIIDNGETREQLIDRAKKLVEERGYRIVE